MGCVLLLASVDTQDNRLECTVRGYGRGCETWTIAHEILYGSPGADEVWQELEDLIFNTEFPHAAGTALRDIAAMQKVFPAYLRRDKDNTLQQKTFLGSILHLRGGKAAKNYRRISVDVVYLDEIDAFDRDVEGEGDPFTLAAKRAEGATFPKIVVASTPKTKGFSLIYDRANLADQRFEFVVPCPSCDHELPITWGGKDEPAGFKWQKDASGDPIPETVRHQCSHCDARFTQGDYLSVWHRGYYLNEDRTITLDHAGHFRPLAGRPVVPPRHIAFVGVWTAYSPAATWANIVRDFAAAHKKAQQGDKSSLKAFTNTTLGLS